MNNSMTLIDNIGWDPADSILTTLRAARKINSSIHASVHPYTELSLPCTGILLKIRGVLCKWVDKTHKSDKELLIIDKEKTTEII